MPKQRTTNRDHAKRLLGFVPWSGNPTGRTPQQRPMIEDEEIAAQLEQLVTPAVMAQEKADRQLGMRDRILNLPLMVAAVLTLIWRDVAGVTAQHWQQLIAGDVHLITRLNNKASFTVERVCTNSYSIRDRIVKMGAGDRKTPWITMRLVEIRAGKAWYSYLTSVLDPLILPPYVVADLDGRRWRIEEAFNTVKRLLGLS